MSLYRMAPFYAPLRALAMLVISLVPSTAFASVHEFTLANGLRLDCQGRPPLPGGHLPDLVQGWKYG